MMDLKNELLHPARSRFVGRAIAVVLLVAAILFIYALATHQHWILRTGASTPQSQQASASHRVLYWYDPMHPAYQSNKPGIAPDCGMELVPKYADDKAATLAQGNVSLNDAQRQIAGVETTAVEHMPLMREITTTAQIVADETRVFHIHTKVPGFAEDVYANVTGSQIHKGEKIFTYYSPDLVSAEQEYLIAKRGGTTLGSSAYSEVRDAATSLLASARQRLKALDLSDEQIAQLERSAEPVRNTAFYSPVSGFITERKIFPQSSITPEQDLYTLSDLSTVWAVVDIYDSDLPFVHIGQRVTFTFDWNPGKTLSGSISFIYPTIDPQTRTAKLRVQLANPGFRLKPQMFANAAIHVDYGKPLVVPRSAVLDSGMSQRVFVAQQGGSYEPRTVVTGPTVGDETIILSGLQVGEVVVSEGNFLIDADSRLKNPSGGAR